MNAIASAPNALTPGDRILGLGGVLGGGALVAAFLPLNWSAEALAVRLVMFNAGAIAIVIAVHRRARALSPESSTAVADVVAVAALLAHGSYVVIVVAGIGRPQPPEADPEFRLVLFVMGAAMWLADATFALVAFRHRVVARLSAAALLIGSLLAFLGMDRLELVRGDLAWFFEPAALAGIALAGAGWTLLGIELATVGRRR
ncbi:MAG: hypothetical protein ACRDIL_17390 [Candidatus Limnocylindrales bacterium]